MKIKQFSCHSFFPMIHGVVVATIYFFPPIMHRHFSSPACVVYPLCNGPTDIERLHQEGEKRKKEEEEKKELTLRLWLWALSVYKVAVFRLPEENVERGGYCCVFWRRGKIQQSSTAQRTEIIPLPLPSMTTQRLVCLVWPPFLYVQCIPRPRLACSTIRITARRCKAPFDQYVLKAVRAKAKRGRRSCDTDRENRVWWCIRLW